MFTTEQMLPAKIRISLQQRSDFLKELHEMSQGVEAITRRGTPMHNLLFLKHILPS